MACHFSDNVYTQIFTPREYQVEVLDAAKDENTVVCASTSSSKTFIAVKLLQELSWKMRKEGDKHAIFILDLSNVNIMSSHIKLLTDLEVASVLNDPIDSEVWDICVSKHSVIVTTIEICESLILAGYFDINNFNLIVIDDCLYGEKQHLIEHLMNEYRKLSQSSEKPRILGLAAGLLGVQLEPRCLEDKLQRLEKLLCCSVNTSSELVTLLRFCCHPRERIIEYKNIVSTPLQEIITNIILDTKEFVMDHRFDLSETYTDEYLEELKQIPDPREQPLEILNNLLKILNDLGPWAVDQASLHLLSLTEKWKVKVPYERHYLLLCLVSSLMVKIRAVCESAFQELTDMERITTYSSPKILRLLEILLQFKPAGERPLTVETKSSPASTKGGRGKNFRGGRRKQSRLQLDDGICALVFVENRITAKVIYTLLYTINQHNPDFWWISALFTVEKVADPIKESQEAETEHRRQEDVLRKYRMHDCNILVSTSVLEQGCDLPKCNLVVRFDVPTTFHSYVQSKARARAADAHYLLLVNESHLDPFINSLSEYMEVEKTLLQRCGGFEPSKQEELEADDYCKDGPVYKPLEESDSPSVTFSTAIALVNRYCAKLPSDTFTRLTPLWSVTQLDGNYKCTLRLPINSPVKQTISGYSNINSLMACRSTAFKTCKYLHQVGELDDTLQPISKENFKAHDEDWNNFTLEEADEALSRDPAEPRPGTTKRRQYYYKLIGQSLMNCLPEPNKPTYFYKIVLTLTCPLPEEQNTRGRRIYPPEEFVQGFGILTSKPIPKICPFPIFTRSGEVSVDIKLCSDSLVMTAKQIYRISEFLNYTFSSVLRLQRYLMLFDPNASSNCYLIAPTRDMPDGTTVVDWDFTNLIYRSRFDLPKIVPEENRVNYKFDPSCYKDAVVMPWYRNQDQPQYFYVAEICNHLNPKSSFPGSEYATFEEYYSRKYSIQIQNKEQHLLDVDHTSARLNFLTPRYVNRKGVALPTSSEETKRAKRENLEQKQILVPELCAIHPFPASLWRKAVCLPCILYRINALLLADQIRRRVAVELGLGKVNLSSDFNWPALNFGWNLADVLRKTNQETKKVAELLNGDVAAIEPANNKDNDNELAIESISLVEEISSENTVEGEDCVDGVESKVWVEIGTWSNDMIDTGDPNADCLIRYGSPTGWIDSTTYDDFSDSDDSYSLDEDSDCGGLKIEFMGDNTAEAVDDEEEEDEDNHKLTLTNAWTSNNYEHCQELADNFRIACETNKKYLLSKEFLFTKDENYQRVNQQSNKLPTQPTVADIKIDWNKICEIKIETNRANRCDTSTEIKGCVKTEVISFSFDAQPNLSEHPGPSPSVILQALTMSNANDGINLERLETIGDSFLKYAITNYLYLKYENVHEGKLSHLRSKQVSNLNLYRLGKQKMLGECMIASKFDPHDNWLPPCYYVPKELEEALMAARVPANHWTPADVAATRDMTLDEICRMVKERGEALATPNIIPYNLVTQHSIPDKSIADCVEALIGAYLIDCGPRGALLFMAWLGMRVLPQNEDGSYGELEFPRSPLLRNICNPEETLDILLDGYNKFESSIGYRFRDKAYLIQALTHASYSPNTLTDCYQRLEFLGDAVLDYLITRHLYEDKRMHSPGALTDLRSALVNNTIFASLAVRHGFHRYFRHLSPGLNEVIERFVRIQEESGHALVEELYLVAEDDTEEVEDVEVPKALGDVFESVAGAIFLDSGMSLDAVWKVYYQMMCLEIERFSDNVPKSPIRELLELEPETAKFGKPEKLADGRRVRVAVEVFGKGVFKGIGRNYRIAKCTAAKCALKYLKRRGLLRRC